MTSTYFATPRHGLSALTCLRWTLLFCKLAGRDFVGAYQDGPDCYAVVIAAATRRGRKTA